MTTTISLATRDCIVLGCDSLATASRPMIDPLPFATQFFDDSGNLRVDDAGRPTLQKASQLRAFLNHVPRDQLPNVTKLYSLEPAHAGILFAGSSGFGNWSIRNLVDAFKQSSEFLKAVGKPHEIETIAGVLFDFLNAKFAEATQSVSDHSHPIGRDKRVRGTAASSGEHGGPVVARCKMSGGWAQMGVKLHVGCPRV